MSKNRLKRALLRHFSGIGSSSSVCATVLMLPPYGLAERCPSGPGGSRGSRAPTPGRRRNTGGTAAAPSCRRARRRTPSFDVEHEREAAPDRHELQVVVATPSRTRRRCPAACSSTLKRWRAPRSAKIARLRESKLQPAVQLEGVELACRRCVVECVDRSGVADELRRTSVSGLPLFRTQSSASSALPSSVGEQIGALRRRDRRRRYWILGDRLVVVRGRACRSRCRNPTSPT